MACDDTHHVFGTYICVSHLQDLIMIMIMMLLKLQEYISGLSNFDSCNNMH